MTQLISVRRAIRVATIVQEAPRLAQVVVSLMGNIRFWMVLTAILFVQMQTNIKTHKLLNAQSVMMDVLLAKVQLVTVPAVNLVMMELPTISNSLIPFHV